MRPSKARLPLGAKNGMRCIQDYRAGLWALPARRSGNHWISGIILNLDIYVNYFCNIIATISLNAGSVRYR
jgi:hypothetical protein